MSKQKKEPAAWTYITFKRYDRNDFEPVKQNAYPKDGAHFWGFDTEDGCVKLCVMDSDFAGSDSYYSMRPASGNDGHVIAWYPFCKRPPLPDMETLKASVGYFPPKGTKEDAERSYKYWRYSRSKTKSEIKQRKFYMDNARERMRTAPEASKVPVLVPA